MDNNMFTRHDAINVLRGIGYGENNLPYVV